MYSSFSGGLCVTKLPQTVSSVTMSSGDTGYVLVLNSFMYDRPQIVRVKGLGAAINIILGSFPPPYDDVVDVEFSVSDIVGKYDFVSIGFGCGYPVGFYDSSSDRESEGRCSDKLELYGVLMEHMI